MKGSIFLRVAMIPAVVAGCQGSTGGARIHFQVAGAGPDADPAEIPEFINRLGYDVSLSRAVLHIGAIYLNQDANIGTTNDQFGCYGGGREVGQVLGGADIDLLSPELQTFSVLGEGTASPARAAAVWLTGPESVDLVQSSQVILSIAGTARRANQIYPFEGSITIGQNHLIPSPNPATPGINPICKQRIVAPVSIGFLLSQGGLLTIRVDPYDLLSGADFSVLHLVAPPPAPPLYRYSDRIDNQADQNLYANLTTPSTYGVFWQSN